MTSADTTLPAETREAIGRKSHHVFEVTARDIRRYADAIGDLEPAHTDTHAPEEIVASPLFCHTMAFEDVQASRLRSDGLPAELDVPLPAARAVGGASSFDVGVDVRPGDVITVTKTIEDIYRKQSRSGELYFVVLDTTYVNQRGEHVAHERGTFINR